MRHLSGLLDATVLDARFAIRWYARSPLLTAVGLISIAVGLAACTLAFAVGEQILPHTAPYVEPERLVSVLATSSAECAGCLDSFSRQAVEEWRRTGLHSIAAISTYRQTIVPSADADRAGFAVTFVDSTFFHTAGARPLLGRALGNADRGPVAVASFAFWQRYTNGSASALGAWITVGDRRLELVGVMPRAFDIPAGTELWLPRAMDVDEGSRTVGLLGLARLSDGATVAQADAELRAVASRVPESVGGVSVRRGAAVIPYEQLQSEASRSPIWLTIAAVLATFLIACCNLGSVLLVRAISREREIAIRIAMGGTARRLYAQFALEAGLLVGVGACGAFVVAIITLPVVADSLSEAFRLELPSVLDTGASLALLLLTIALCGFVASLGVPALRRVQLASSLRTSAGTAGPSRRLRTIFVAVQVVGLFVLVTGAGLLLRSFSETQHHDIGVRDQGVLASQVTFRSADTATTSALSAAGDFISSSLERAIPRAKVALWSATNVEHFDARTPEFSLDDGAVVLPALQRWPRPYPIMSIDMTPGSFALLDMRLMSGRDFARGDGRGAEPVVILNELAAKMFGAGRPIIGRRLKLGGPASPEPWLTVIGVVSNSAPLTSEGLGLALIHSETAVPLMFRPYAQAPGARTVVAVRPSEMTNAVARLMTRTLRSAMPPDAAVSDAAPMRSWMSDTGIIRRLKVTAQALTCLAAVAVLLALMGIYGLAADLVSSRTREIGIRMALGAGRRHVVGLVLRDNLRVGSVATAVGIAIAAVIARVASTALYGIHPTTMRLGLLFGVSASNPLYYGLGAAAVLAVIGLATALPAWRAVTIQPLVALRWDD